MIILLVNALTEAAALIETARENDLIDAESPLWDESIEIQKRLEVMIKLAVET